MATPVAAGAAAAPGGDRAAELRALGAARWATFAVFTANGFAFGSWAARVPAVKELAGLSEPQLGLALLGLAVTSVPSLVVGGALAARIGSRLASQVGLAAWCGSLALAPFAGGLASLFGVLCLVGVGAGLVDPAMNAQGAVVQRRLARPVMSGFHGGYSLGTLGGAGVAAVAAATGVDVRVSLPASCLAALVLGLAWSGRMLPAADTASTGGPRFARPTRALAAVAAIGFCGLLGEGIANDWAAVYVRESLAGSGAVAAAAYGAFSATMTLGRLVGDRLTARFGAAGLVRTSASVALVGFSTGLAVPHPAAAVAGFALLGCGLAVVVPVVFTAAARTPGVAESPAIAAVSSVGYGAFLAGPPLIGGLAGLVGLRLALLVVVAALAVVVTLAGRLEPRR